MNKKDENNQDSRSFNSPGRDTLNETDVDGLGLALLTLTKEVWVLKDRLMVMEKVLANRDIDISEEIDQFQPDEAFQRELKEQGQALVERVLTALKNSD